MISETNGINVCTRVLIVDDYLLMRAGIAAVLETDPYLQVCGAVGSEAEALKMARSARPDIAIVDLSLSIAGGLTLFCKLCRALPKLRILVLSMHDEKVYAERALDAGAHGYVMKEDAAASLLNAVWTVRNGGVYLSSRMRNTLLLREPPAATRGLLATQPAYRSDASRHQVTETAFQANTAAKPG